SSAIWLGGRGAGRSQSSNRLGLRKSILSSVERFKATDHGPDRAASRSVCQRLYAAAAVRQGAADLRQKQQAQGAREVAIAPQRYPRHAGNLGQELAR